MDKAHLKERFRGFNSEFEETYRTQKFYSVPDPEVKRALQEASVDMVLPLYKEFVTKYAAVPFSKNMSKYVRYNADTLSAMIRTLFDE